MKWSKVEAGNYINDTRSFAIVFDRNYNNWDVKNVDYNRNIVHCTQTLREAKAWVAAQR